MQRSERDKSMWEVRNKLRDHMTVVGRKIGKVIEVFISFEFDVSVEGTNLLLLLVLLLARMLFEKVGRCAIWSRLFSTLI